MIKNYQEHVVEIKKRDLLQNKNGKYLYIKRSLDILVACISLIIFSPLMIILMVVIYLDDPNGSPIYSQVRIGQNGKPFKFYKFRSMYMNAEDRLEEILEMNEMKGPSFKIKDDPRITKVGHFIRKCSLDELPQLVNVLRGDMAIVGPRPPLPREVAQYDEYQKLRLSIQPGLTCYWQVQSRRNDIDFDRWVELDLKYIGECKLSTDIKIIFQTIGVVFTGEGE